jgi:hypothetical protein
VDQGILGDKEGFSIYNLSILKKLNGKSPGINKNKKKASSGVTMAHAYL